MSSARAPQRPATSSLLVGTVVGLLATAGIGASQAVRDEPPSPPPATALEAHTAFEPQTRCEPVEQPGVVAFRELVLGRFPGTRDGGIVRACHIGGTSEHKEGRAWDWMVDAHDPAQAAMAEELLGWLLAPDDAGNEHAMARRLGVMYVIWDGRIWSASRAAEGWRPFPGPNAHHDHVHVSFGRAGAAKATSFWEAPTPIAAPAA